jgi:serine/threonine protein kinase
MSLAKEFYKVVKEHFEPLGFTFSEFDSMPYWNIIRLYDPANDKYYIAKGITHIENSKELGPTQMDKQYNTEKGILSNLPDWWHLQLKDSFKKNGIRVIVTPEIPNCEWSKYKGNDKKIAEKIHKQIEWLHNNKIAHADLHLKNILLTCDNKDAIIIDFEKSIKNASDATMKEDYRKVIDKFIKNKNTKGIGLNLYKLAGNKLPLNYILSTRSKTKNKPRKSHKSHKTHKNKKY